MFYFELLIFVDDSCAWLFAVLGCGYYTHGCELRRLFALTTFDTNQKCDFGLSSYTCDSVRLIYAIKYFSVRFDATKLEKK